MTPNNDNNGDESLRLLAFILLQPGCLWVHLTPCLPAGPREPATGPLCHIQPRAQGAQTPACPTSQFLTAHEFPGAAVKNDQKVGGFKQQNYSLTVLEARV